MYKKSYDIINKADVLHKIYETSQLYMTDDLSPDTLNIVQLLNDLLYSVMFLRHERQPIGFIHASHVIQI